MTQDIIISATTFLLLFLSPSWGNAADTSVLDTEGRPLRAKSRYYILPASQGQGGGITVSQKNQTTLCPLYVSQESQEIYLGLSVWFLPSKHNQRLIYISSDINILFNMVNMCLQSAAWKLTIDHTTWRKYVATGGAIGNPGEETVSSWFKIEKVKSGSYEYDYNYKIMYCPNVCSFCMVICGDVGVFVQDDGTRLLGLSDRPFYVMFKKAKSRMKQKQYHYNFL
ncbi:kunitz trypsin inhibitor 5 [Beta vulgaris subsp. vulgaris]|uniref:kunitz trypsin inhibitor 5 n=1 Tax=Beta vulgaris subsp. vulgaris TaxID=3555 RepID=UPI0020375D04|nr:kunitz trypsin inhibitor 5 [Beta vulgaris subsp. vulgaris]